MPEDRVFAGEVAAGLFWSRAGLRDSFENLIARSNLPLTAQTLPGRPSDDSVLRAIQWLRRAPRAAGLDVIEEPDISLETLLSRFMELRGPVLALFILQDQMVILTATFESGRWVRVFKPDGGEVRMDRAALYERITRLMATDSRSISAIFDSLPGGSAVLRKMQARDALGDRRHTLLLRFELDGSHLISEQLSAVGAWRSLAVHVTFSALQALAALAAFWTLGNSMIDGQIDLGRVIGWTILAASDAPLQYLASQALAHFTISFASSVKRRLLEGAFFIPENHVRARGFGDLLARTNEASIVEQLSLSEVSGVVLAVFEVVGAGWFLAKGEPRYASLGALAACLLMAAIVVRATVRAYDELFARRLKLTDDLVDKIIGHRTRAVQQAPSQRHPTEDFALSDYARVARRFDRVRALCTSMPRIWLVVGALILFLAFVGRAPTSALVYSGLGILLCYRALVAFFPSVQRILEWRTSWRGIEALITAGLQRERASRPLDRDLDEGNFATTLSMSAVTFAYRNGGRPIVNQVELRVQRGEKVLLEGASGSGKTTILKLIAGEQQATGGVILVGGTDRYSVSDVDWRRRVASAPQFQENYVFSNTLAFNLDPWGERGFESQEAREICGELGLTPVIERMPQGFAQLVGETGWQLSHGERSRLFIARALLQKSDLFLFDENFGALDPETLMQALECVRRRAKTLIVVAHT